MLHQASARRRDLQNTADRLDTVDIALLVDESLPQSDYPIPHFGGKPLPSLTNCVTMLLTSHGWEPQVNPGWFNQ